MKPTEENLGTVLSFAVSGAQETPNTGIGAKASNSVGSEKGVFAIEEKVIEGKDFDIVVSGSERGARALTSSTIGGSSSIAAKAAAGMRASTSALGPNVKYRIVLVNTSTGVRQDTVVTVGSIPNVPVKAGQSYNWYVYSLNNVDTPPALNANGTLSASSIANKDLLYKSGTVTAVTGSNGINVVLDHKTAIIAVHMDARNINANIVNAGTYNVVTGSPTTVASPVLIKQGDFNVLGTSAGTFTNISDASAVTASTTTFIPDATFGNQLKTVYFYSATGASVAANTLAINGKFTINSGGTNQTSANQITRLPNTAFSFAQGSLYDVNLTFKKQSIVVGNVAWSTTNLYYDAADANNHYKFRDFNNYVGVMNQDYWNYGATTTDPLAKDVGADPCTLVPGGAWRLPTTAEFAALIGGYVSGTDPVSGVKTGHGTSSANTVEQTWFGQYARIDWVTNGIHFPGQGVRFNNTGNASLSTIMNSVTTAPINTTDGSGRKVANNVWIEYMSKDKRPDFNQIQYSNNYLWVLVQNDLYPNYAPKMTNPDHPYIFASGVVVVGTRGINIRCVRTAN